MADGAKPSRETFRAFYEQNFSIVWKQLRRLNVPPADVPDLAHEVLYVAYRRFDEVPASPRGWLARVSFELVRNYRKKAARRLETLNPDLIDEAPSVAYPENAMAEVVLEALDRMPEDQRSLLLRHHLGDETLQMLAKDLGLARSTVQLRIAAAEATFEGWVKTLLDPREDEGQRPFMFVPFTLATLLPHVDEPITMANMVGGAKAAIWERLAGQMPTPAPNTVGDSPHTPGGPWAWARHLGMPSKLVMVLGIGGPAAFAGMMIGLLGRDMASAHANPNAIVPKSFAPVIALALIPPSRAVPAGLAVSAVALEGTKSEASAATRKKTPLDKKQPNPDLDLIKLARATLMEGKCDEGLALLRKHAVLFDDSSHTLERNDLFDNAHSLCAMNRKP